MDREPTQVNSSVGEADVVAAEGHRDHIELAARHFFGACCRSEVLIPVVAREVFPSAEIGRSVAPVQARNVTAPNGLLLPSFVCAAAERGHALGERGHDQRAVAAVIDAFPGRMNHRARRGSRRLHPARRHGQIRKRKKDPNLLRGRTARRNGRNAVLTERRGGIRLQPSPNRVVSTCAVPPTAYRHVS